ncbi:MAG: hypothetical protein LBI49_25635 [Nocardiopsaceae bacterium]|jgi:hypothetical protein|nr:hypothetical protein [Nocardiopsaceae bacterium]
MPLTKHGRKMLARFRAEYGKRKGTSVFYATARSRRQGGRDKIGKHRIHPGALRKSQR